MGLDLITKSEYKDYIGIKGDTQDSEIDSLIPTVSSLVKNYCRRTFVDHVNDAKVETFNGGTAMKKFLLHETPVISIVGVETSTDYGQNYTDMVEYTDYVYDTTNECLVYLPGDEFPELINGYKVSYYAGYEFIPEDLKLAIFDLITFYLKNDGVVKNLRVPTTQVMQLEYVSATNFPSNIARVLNLHKASWD
jgi:hypothetical protein